MLLRPIWALLLSVAAAAQPAPDLPVFLRVPSDAMAPAIPAGTVLVRETVNQPLSAGDVVLVREPKRQVALLALRVAALPESRVEFVERSILVDGKSPAGARRPLIGPPFPWPGLEPQPNDSNVYRVPKESYFLLADNPDEALDSRSFGPVPRALVVGLLHRWDEVAKDQGTARSYLERSVAALRRALPLKLPGGLLVTSISMDRGYEISLSARLDVDYKGSLPMPEAELSSLRTEFIQSYCRSEFGRYAPGLGAKYVLNDRRRQIALVRVSGSDCRSQ
jgi:signal peptidase I